MLSKKSYSSSTHFDHTMSIDKETLLHTLYISGLKVARGTAWFKISLGQSFYF